MTIESIFGYQCNHPFLQSRASGDFFSFFDEGLIIYDMIRNTELEHHGQDIIALVDRDIASGRIEVYTDQKLKNFCVYKIFAGNVKDNWQLYDAGDLGEVYAISLAQTLGAYSLVTDDIKQRGPYMSLLQFNHDIMPFTFADILILRYLLGTVDEAKTIEDFDLINSTSTLNWSFKSQIRKFIKRFYREPYRDEDTIWIDNLARMHNCNFRKRIVKLVHQVW